MAVRSVPKLGTEVLEFMEPIWAVRDSSQTAWAC